MQEICETRPAVEFQKKVYIQKWKKQYILSEKHWHLGIVLNQECKDSAKVVMGYFGFVEELESTISSHALHHY